MSSGIYDMQNTEQGRAKVILEKVTPETLKQYAPRLAALTTSHINKHNRSINFLHPFTSQQAVDLFLKVSPFLSMDGPGRVIMWVAKLPPDERNNALQSINIDGEDTGHSEIVGTVQLAFHTSPNGVHRSEVRKLIVDDRYERRGIARTLMLQLQRVAKEEGSTLCLLDTEAGYAEHFYTKLGWKLSGYVPNYAMTPDGLEKRDAAYMYLEL